MKEESVESTALFSSSWFEVSWFDIAIISVVLLGVAYYFLKPKKKTEQTLIADFKIIPPSAGSEQKNFIEKMKSTNRNIVAFYGSQTGTAEDFAGRISKTAISYGMKGLACDPEESDMEELSELINIEKSVAIFCMATYGEGDPTDNTQEFIDLLKGDSLDLSGLRFAVFGLGNKTYEHYNSMGKLVDKRLEELGGERIYALGLGDDDANIEEDFVSWHEELWKAICARFGMSSDVQDIRVRQYTMDLVNELTDVKVFSGEIARINSFKVQKPPYDMKNPLLAKVIVNKELHKAGDRSCMHIELDISNSRLRYDCGDHVAIYPTNDANIVERLGDLLKIDLDQVFVMNNIDEDSTKRHPFPCPTTFRTAFSHYVDITLPLKTNVLRELSDYAEDEAEKNKLILMSSSSAEGKALYNEFILNARRHIVAVLEDFPSVHPEVNVILELLPRLQSRYYSISSSPKLYPNSVHVTAVLVDYVTTTGRQMNGVATAQLKTKIPTDEMKPTVPVFIRRSQFRLPFKCNTPVIMIGPGTGLAPFRGFIQDRMQDKKNGKPVGEVVLYFGCRKKAEDYIYEEELEEACHPENGVITNLYAAFSRDQAEKVYVQDLMKRPEAGKQTWELLEKGGHFYVCGDARNMARCVLETLESIVMQYGEKSQPDAALYIKKLQNKGRYAADV